MQFNPKPETLNLETRNRYFEHCSDEVRDACSKKLKEMEGMGAAVIDIEIENRDMSTLVVSTQTLNPIPKP